MKPRSAKNKGMRLQKIVVEMLLNAFNWLTRQDIRSVPSGVPGTDIWLSEAAQKAIGLAIECKNTEKINIWEAINQMENENRIGIPILIFKRNRSKIYCCLEFENFLNFYRTQ